MGKFALDFSENSKALRGSVADIEIGMASVNILLPSEGPVVLEVPDSWFCSVEVPDGYVKARQGEYHSPAYSSDDHDDAFVVRVEASVGKVSFAVR